MPAMPRRQSVAHCGINVRQGFDNQLGSPALTPTGNLHCVSFISLSTLVLIIVIATAEKVGICVVKVVWIIRVCVHVYVQARF